jgi:hypothetical protein
MPRICSTWTARSHAAVFFLMLFATVVAGDEPGRTVEQSGQTDGADGAVMSAGGDPREVINQFVRQRWQRQRVSPAAPCGDAEFARRVYLDLAGRIPTVEELDRFLATAPADVDPTSATTQQRRSRLVDELLQGSDFPQHMADVFDTLLMGRKPLNVYQQRQQSGWRDYLVRAFAKNRPWNQVAREILLARPAGDEDRGATWFLFERNNKHQDIAEAIGPAIFGVRLDCAQCHDHPLASEIEQRHYWGLVAFFRRGQNTQSKHGPRIAEAAVGGYEQFADLSGDSQPNLLVFLGDREVEEPRPEAGQKEEDADALYQEATVEGELRIPRFSRRQKFVDEVLAGHPLVARAMVNRMWALLMGRGMVHPHDEMDSRHEPSHPELLRWLAEDYERSGFDTRRLARAIVMSDAYQLSSQKPAENSDPADFNWALDKPLIAESWWISVSQLVRGTASDDAPLLATIRQQFPDVLPGEPATNVGQALFLSNHASWNAWLRESRDPSHLVPRLQTLPDHATRVRHLFAAAYAREPDEDELQAATAFLTQREDRLVEALDNLIWAVVSSAEFRMNH